MTTEQKHEIEIPGLPKGYRAVAYRIADYREWYFFEGRIVQNIYTETQYPVLIVEKIKPREVTFVETDCENAKIAFFDDAGMWTYWRIKEE